MKFEHRKQKVVPLTDFLIRLGRYGLFAALLIFISLAIGTLGYHYVSHLHFLDSFYMSSMILTGMGPVADVKMDTTAAKLFSSFYALYSGIAFLSITAVFFTPIIHRVLHILQVDTDS
jgi:hypothetical protein